MEYYLAALAFIICVWIVAWYINASEKSTQQIISEKILLIENNFKAAFKKQADLIAELKESNETLRSTLMAHKLAHQADIYEAQRKVYAIEKSQRRISNHQFKIKGMIEAKATLVPYEVKQIERGH